MPHDVFISYSSVDKNAADNVCSILEQNGISCWIAPRDITPGVPFAEAIIKAIKESKVFILVYTQNSNGSQQVIKEVDRAVHHGLTVITLRLEDVKMSDQLEYYISDVHWLDALTPPLEDHINRLSKVVKMLMSKEEVKDDDLEKAIRKGTLRLGKTGKPGAGTGRYRSPWKSTVAAAVVIMAILVAVLLVIPRLSKEMDKSVAVLPFTNLSDDPDQEYFSDGMMDEILDRLFKIGDLKVISRTSSMRYKNSDLSLKEIAGELGVSAILEGSVRKAGNLVRITVQLIDARNDTHLWSETYDGDLSDLSKIFAMQSEVAQSVAKELKAVIAPEEKQLIDKIPTENPEAYEAIQKGQYFLNKFTADALDSAMQYFELAKEIDPDNVLAYTGIARVWTFRRQSGLVTTAEGYQKSMDALMKAHALDSNNAEVQSGLAGIKVWSMFDWEGGESAFKKSISLNPNNAFTHAAYSHLLIYLGRPDEAMEQIDIALKLDPMNPFIITFYGIVLTMSRKYDEALKAFQDALKIDPDFSMAQGQIGFVFQFTGKYREALEQWKLMCAKANDTELLNAYVNGYAEGGFKGAHLAYAKVAELRFKNSYWAPIDIAMEFAMAGENDKTLYWLDQAYKVHDPNLPLLLYPVWDQLRDDSRFQEIARKMNLPYK